MKQTFARPVESEPAAPAKAPVDDRVEVTTADGQRGTILRSEAKAFEAAGGKVLSEQEILQEKQQAEYDQASLGQKALGFATGGTAGAVDPTLRAYQEGAREGLSSGLYKGAMRQAIGAIDEKAAAKYEQQLEEVKKAHETAYTVGEVGGFIGQMAIGAGAGGGGLNTGGTGLARLLPANAAAALGAGVEGAATRATAGLAARGALGRAGAAAVRLGARGATEAAILSTSEQLGDDLFHDKELTAEKYVAAVGHGALAGGLGGAALGGGGSLLASGGRAAAQGAAEALGGLARRAEGAAGKVAGEGEGLIAKGARAAQEKLATIGDDGGRKMAYEAFYDSLGSGQGLQSTKYAKEIEALGGKAALGKELQEIAFGYVGKGSTAVQDIYRAGAMGKPAEMLEHIQAGVRESGERLGQLRGGLDAEIPFETLAKDFDQIAKKYAKDIGKEGFVPVIREYSDKLARTQNFADMAEAVAQGAKIDANELLRQREFLDQAINYERKSANFVRKDAITEFRWGMEDRYLNSLEEGLGGDVLKAVKEEKMTFRRRRHLEKLAEDSAARQSKAATFGLRSTKLAGAGAMVGGFIAGPMGAAAGGALGGLGSKLMIERGQAAMGAALLRAAEAGTIAKAVRYTDQLIERSARGLLTTSEALERKALPKVTGGPYRGESVSTKASKAMAVVKEVQANPESYGQAVNSHVSSLEQVAPETADSVRDVFLRGMSWLMSKLPPTNTDPLDPRQKPKLSLSQKHTLASYYDYTTEPRRFFRDVERGKVTPEGVEVMQQLYPRLYAQFQAQTMDALSDRVAAGHRIPYSQRLKIGALFNIPADWSLEPQAMQGIQDALQSTQGSQPNAPPMGPNRPMKRPAEQSDYDRILGS